MGLKFDGLETVKLQRESYRFRVRVVRKWFVPGFMNPEQPMSMELILMDESGNRIQATVRKSVLYKFSEIIKEGSVYPMSYFGVVHNTGSYRATPHEFKLVFQPRTTISEYSCDTIPFFGVVPVAFDVVNSLNGEHDYLIDVVGMMTDLSAQREYLRDGKVTRMIVLELTDHVGKIDCTLFGDYVDQVISFLHDFRSFPPMIVLHYAKVKIFKGKPVVQNTLYASRLLINPDVPEVTEIRERIIASGFSFNENCSYLSETPKKSVEDEFLKLYPKKSIDEVLSGDEDAISIIMATVTEVVNDGQWWYPACKCHKSVIHDNGVYYCSSCTRHVFNVIPRYKLKIDVSDISGSGILILFDYDVEYLVRKSCSEMLSSFMEGVEGQEYPPIFNSLLGRKLLFKVVKSSTGASATTGAIKVCGVCDDPNIMSMYELPGFDLPHEEAIPVSHAAPVIDLTADHSPELAEDIAFSASVIVSPASVESVTSASVVANVSPDVITPPAKLKKKFDAAFGDCSPPPDAAPKRANKALKK